MKVIEIGNEMPLALKSMNINYNANIRMKAKKNIYFSNYKPLDENLGEKSEDQVIIGDKIEKEYNFKIDKAVRNMFENEKAPLKIIPKKSTIDIKRKLAEPLQK